MALLDTTGRESYAGNSSTTAFSYPHKFRASADIKAILVTNATGAEVVWVLATNFTMTGAGVDAGGTLTALVAPATGKTLVIYTEIANAQALDLSQFGSLSPESIEDELDNISMVARRHKNLLSRAVRLPDGDTSGFDGRLPPLLASNPGATLILGPAGLTIALGPTAAQVSSADASAVAAAASAAAAAAALAATIASAVGFVSGSFAVSNAMLELQPTMAVNSATYKYAEFWIGLDRSGLLSQVWFYLFWSGSAWSIVEGPSIGDAHGLTLTLSGTTSVAIIVAADNSGNGTARFNGRKM